MQLRRLHLLLSLFAVCGNAFSQPLEPGQPFSKSPIFQQISSANKPPTVSLAAPAEAKNVDKFNDSPLVGLPMTADISFQKSGSWLDLPGGDRLWQLEMESPGAAGLLLIFDLFLLPDGGKLWVSDENGEQLIGAFTEKSCLPSGKMTIGPVRGEYARLEYFEPAAAKNQGQINLNRVDFIFNKTAVSGGAESSMPFGFGGSLGCHININCPDGASFQSEKKGVARALMVVTAGTVFCTGTMLNQSSASKKPFLMTAFHCIDGFSPLFDQCKFDFKYEGAGCANPATEPVPQSVVGCTQRAGRQQTDFLLLELNPIPANFDLWLNGWNRSTTALPASTVFIHHPQGDVKKWSKDAQAATLFASTIAWNNGVTSPANSHFKTVTDQGTFEVGSSGCSLLDPQKRVVGVLHGGVTTGNGCTVTAAYFGRFGLAWNEGTTAATRLMDWLDPAGLSPMTVDGEPYISAVTISGNVKTAWNLPMPNVKILLSGGKTDSTRTNSAGDFTFNVDAGKTYQVRPLRDSADINGISTFDLVDISKHILGAKAFDSPWKWLAGDANKTNTVSTFDIVDVRKVILGVWAAFGANTSWRFVPTSHIFPPTGNPLSASMPEQREIQVASQNILGLDFKGVKIGDANQSADANY